jgi:hypothetical protein
MHRRPSGSHLNTHNAAMNRVFNKAVVLGYANKGQLPKLKTQALKQDAEQTLLMGSLFGLLCTCDTGLKRHVLDTLV